MARDEGWLAEHMLILKLTSPDGRVKHVTGAFPSACGKTNLAMLIPTLPGLEGRDGRRRHRLDEVRRRRPALRDQPRGGLLRRRARHVARRRTRTRWPRIRANSIFTNCALTDDGDIWWEGMTEQPPSHAIDWQGEDWTPERGRDRRRTRTRASRRPPRSARRSRDDWEDPKGVPIDAFLFGGRRATVVPLVTEAFDWDHGVFMGAIMGSEKTAAAAGAVGELRFDPMAMLPFCGYHMADYFGALARRSAAARARSCRRSSWSTGSARTTSGRFLWPGFGENSRVLAWVFERCDDQGGGGGDADRPGAGGGRARHLGPRPARRTRWRSCSSGPRGVAGPAAAAARALRACSATGCPSELERQLNALEERLT